MKMRKKLLALVMVLAMMAVAIFAITACRDPEEPYVTGITATYTQQANITPATALSQLAGGLRVVANYSDETYREIPFNPVDGFSLSGNLNQAQSVITVTYGEHTTTFTVNVTIAATIYGIEVEFNRPEGLIVTPATNLESILEHLDVEVILTDGTRRPLAQGETIVLTGNFNVALNTITANLGTHSDTFTVESRVATGIAVQFNQQLTENFITPQTPLNDIREHATVTVTYSDGHTRTLPNAEFTLYGNLNVASSELIARHISHGVLHVSAPFNVTVRVVEGIAVDFTQPATLITPTTPLAYLAGTLLVTASYNIGPTSTPNFDATGANGFTLTGDLSVLNANDEATVTVNYRGLSATFLVEVDASVYMTGILSATVAPDQARVHIGMNPNDISIKNQITVVAQYSVGTRELLSDEFILSVANDSFVLGSNLVTVTTVIGNFTATVFIYVQQMEFSDLNQIPVPAGRTRIFLYNGFTQWNTVFIDVPAAYSSGGAVTTGAPRYQALMNQMGTTDWWWFDLTVPATLTNPTWGFWINFGDPAEALLNPQGFRIHGSSNFAVGDYPYAGLNFFVFYRSENAWSSATSQYYTGYVRIRNTAVADAARGFNSATALLTEANRYFNQPEVESGTFDQLNPGDVELSANLKGRAIDSLTLGNETLVEDVDFIYYDGTLTILEAFFATRDIGSFEFTITTVGNFTSTFTILVFYDGADPFNMLPAIPTGQVRLFFYNGFINIINPHMYMWIGGGVPSMTPRWTVETTRVDGTNWFFIDTRGDWPAGDILWNVRFMSGNNWESWDPSGQWSSDFGLNTSRFYVIDATGEFLTPVDGVETLAEARSIVDGLSNDPVVQDGTFFTDNGGDLVLSAVLRGLDITSISLDGVALIEGTDFSYLAGDLTIYEAFLMELTEGTHTLTITTTGGYNSTFEIVVVEGAEQYLELTIWFYNGFLEWSNVNIYATGTASALFGWLPLSPASGHPDWFNITLSFTEAHWEIATYGFNFRLAPDNNWALGYTFWWAREFDANGIGQSRYFALTAPSQAGNLHTTPRDQGFATLADAEQAIANHRDGGGQPVETRTLRLYFYNGFLNWGTVMVHAPYQNAFFSWHRLVDAGNDWLVAEVTLPESTWSALSYGLNLRFMPEVEDAWYAGFDAWWAITPLVDWATWSTRHFVFTSVTNNLHDSIDQGFSSRALANEAIAIYRGDAIPPTVANGAFDLYNPSDVTLSANLRDGEIETLTLGSVELVEGVDFSYDDGYLTIYQSFLETLAITNHQFILTTDLSETTFNISVTDSSLVDPWDALPARPANTLRIFLYTGLFSGDFGARPRIHSWAFGTEAEGGVGYAFNHTPMNPTGIAGWWFLDSNAGANAWVGNTGVIVFLPETGGWNPITQAFRFHVDSATAERFFVASVGGAPIEDNGFSNRDAAESVIYTARLNVTRVWFYNSNTWANPRMHAFPGYPLGGWFDASQEMIRYGTTNWWFIDVARNATTAPFTTIIRAQSHNPQVGYVLIDCREYVFVTVDGERHSSKASAEAHIRP